MHLFRHKFVWIGKAVVLVVLTVFGLAMMGSVLGAKPKELPVALVVTDRPVELPTGGTLSMGDKVKMKVEGIAGLPVKWVALGSEEEALKALDREEAYGALVIPADFTAGILSLSTPNPAPATVKLYVNEGMNAQGATAVKTILGQLAGRMGAELSGQLLEQLGQQAEPISAGTAKALLAPFATQEIAVHSAGANNANGGAPNMLTQIAWMGSLVGSVFLYLAASAARRGGSRWGVAAAQVAIGVVLAGIVSAFTVWMAHSWYGMAIQDLSSVWLFLWLVASAFLLLQTALLNWIGMPAMGLLVLLLFFSMPLLNVPPEFMPQATRDWIYSWTPFRYAASGLRSMMYYGGEDGRVLPVGVMAWLAAGCAAVALASAFRRERPAAGGEAEAAAPAAAAN